MPIRDPIIRAENHKRYMRDVWYPKNKAKQIAASRATKLAIKAFIVDYKMRMGCADCGYNKHPAALDFDHLSDDKLFSISQSWSKGYGLVKVKAEMKKCEVVCANCHRIRTVMREGGEVSSMVS